jgi:hypothetical protein
MTKKDNGKLNQRPHGRLFNLKRYFDACLQAGRHILLSPPLARSAFAKATARQASIIGEVEI